MNAKKYLTKKSMRLGFSLSLCLLFLSSHANAATLGFYCITNTSVANCATGEAQLTVDVTAAGSQVLFYFTNSGPNDSSIADVYFDDGSLLGIASIDNSSSGVSFSAGASPSNLPGAGNISPNFVTTAGFSADSDAPVQPNGVNPGEYLGIYFNLQGTQTYADVINELTTGTLRIGIHVQGYSNDGSESFVNNPVPVPAAVWLFGSGLLGLAGIARRRKK